MQKVKNTWLPDGDNWFPSQLDEGGCFERGNLEAALKYVQHFGVAVDGGAHVGTWAREMAKVFREVHAFEPHPDNFECLVMNADVTCYPYGLSDRDEEVSLGVGNNTGCHFVKAGSGTKLKRLPELPGLDFLKLDIEGYEWFALKGAEEQILRYRPVILIEEKSLPHAVAWPKARTLLESWGYEEADRIRRDVIFV